VRTRADITTVTPHHPARPWPAALVAAGVLIAVLGGCAVPQPPIPHRHFRSEGAGEPAIPWCDGTQSLETPAGASPAAAAYVAAVRASMPAWQAVSDHVGRTGMVDSNDLIAQADADEAFLAAIKAIDYPPEILPAAQDLYAAIVSYHEYLRHTLDTAFEDEARAEQSQAANADRSAASHALRADLDLPPTPCAYHRP
jgi:hypothetical protein